jgi:hypothetical protein
MLQDRFPLGASPFVAPVIVAETVSVPPSVGVEGTFAKTIVGSAGATTVVVEEAVAVTGLYVPSPMKMKFAP